MSVLKGRVALITGASRGIGSAIAQRFAAEGASVVVCASRLGAHGKLQGTLEEVANSINASGGRAAAIACDLSDAAARSDLIARASEPFGTVDILVNNAAVARMILPSMISTKDRNLMHDLNLNVPVELAQQALPGMREKGSGWILNISSRTASQPEVPYPDEPMAAHIIGAYGASKAALDRFTEALAHEVASDNIFVNSMAPSNIVFTPGAAYVRDIGLRRPDMVEPIEMMAEAALLLCSASHVGRVVFSRNVVHENGRRVMSLDGKQVLGDALMPADLELS